MKKALTGLLIICLLLSTALQGFAGEPGKYAPYYRVESKLINGVGYNALTATVQLPTGNDINGIEGYGACYNYLGIETSTGAKLEIGLYKDNKLDEYWTVFSKAYKCNDRAFAAYKWTKEYYPKGLDPNWIEFRNRDYMKIPELKFSGGSTVTMTLRVTADKCTDKKKQFYAVYFDIKNVGEESKTIGPLYIPGADPMAKKQILRRVTSITTDTTAAYFKNVVWKDVQIKRPNEKYNIWKPEDGVITRDNVRYFEVSVSNNNDYSQTIDIKPRE